MLPALGVRRRSFSRVSSSTPYGIAQARPQGRFARRDQRFGCAIGFGACGDPQLAFVHFGERGDRWVVGEQEIAGHLLDLAFAQADNMQHPRFDYCPASSSRICERCRTMLFSTIGTSSFGGPGRQIAILPSFSAKVRERCRWSLAGRVQMGFRHQRLLVERRRRGDSCTSR